VKTVSTPMHYVLGVDNKCLEIISVFISLTLLVGRQEGYLACKLNVGGGDLTGALNVVEFHMLPLFSSVQFAKI